MAAVLQSVAVNNLYTGRIHSLWLREVACMFWNLPLNVQIPHDEPTKDPQVLQLRIPVPVLRWLISMQGLYSRNIICSNGSGLWVNAAWILTWTLSSHGPCGGHPSNLSSFWRNSSKCSKNFGLGIVGVILPLSDWWSGSPNLLLLPLATGFMEWTGQESSCPGGTSCSGYNV